MPNKPWFRFYSEVPDDAKVQALSGDLFKLWVNVLCIASRHDGVVPGMKEMTFTLRMTPAEVTGGMDALKKAGLFERVAEAIVPHNWNGRQFQSDSSTERTRRYRASHGNATGERHGKRHGDGGGNVPGDVSGTHQRQRHRQRQKEAPQSPPEGGRFEQKFGADLVVVKTIEEGFSEFWQAYPHKVARPDGLKAYIAARTGTKVRGKPERQPATHDQIMAGIARYQHDKPADHHWLHPATFLNGERFDDDPAPNNGGDENGGGGRRQSSRGALLGALVGIATAGAGLERGEADADDGLSGETEPDRDAHPQGEDAAAAHDGGLG